MRGFGRRRGQLLVLFALTFCVFGPAHASHVGVTSETSSAAAVPDGALRRVDFTVDRPTAPTPPKWIELLGFASLSAAIAVALRATIAGRRELRAVARRVPVSWHRRGPPLLVSC